MNAVLQLDALSGGYGGLQVFRDAAFSVMARQAS